MNTARMLAQRAGAVLAMEVDAELCKAIAERLGSNDFTLESLAGRICLVASVYYFDSVPILAVGPIERAGSKYTRKIWRM